MTTAPVDPCAIILAKIKSVEDQNPGRGGQRNAAVTFALGVLDGLLEEMKAALQADVAQSPAAGHEQRPSN